MSFVAQANSALSIFLAESELIKKQPLAERIVLSAELARVELCSSLPWDATYWDAAANDVQTLADLASPIMGMCGCVDASKLK